MPKWKYQNPEKQKRYTDYKTNRLYIENDKPFKLVISDWEFPKSSGSTPSFKCFVVEENGKKVDKHWSVWDYELKEALKAKLKGKKPASDKVEITVTRHQKGMEESFDLK
jgi:hypothetical protein